MDTEKVLNALEAARDTFSRRIGAMDIPKDDNALIEVVNAIQAAFNTAIRTLGGE